MKPFSTLLVLTLLLASCKKNQLQNEQPYLKKVEATLSDSLPGTDGAGLDYSRAVLSKVDSAGLYLLRIPFRNKAFRNDFVLVKTDKDGRVEKGKIIHLEGQSSEYGEGAVKKRYFDGKITISSLDRKTVLNSPIKKGWIEAFHKNRNLRTTSLMPPEEETQEVVVVAYYVDNRIYYSDYLYLERLLSDNHDSGGGSWGSYYVTLDGGSLTYGDGGGVTLDPPILIDYENQDGLEPIDIQKYLNCFTAIPDAGSSCSIEIFSDIPVDTSPNMLFDFNNGSPGHTFIQIKKSNSSQSAIQNIGFYPRSGWKTILTNAPIEGKFVDNSQHEFNASFKMQLSPENFQSILTEILYLANFIKYDIDNYNCTDFALDVFNKTRTNKLMIDLYDIPGNYPSIGTRTPQGLYNKLKQMKDSNHPEASNITINNYKGWVANSSGSCN